VGGVSLGNRDKAFTVRVSRSVVWVTIVTIFFIWLITIDIMQHYYYLIVKLVSIMTM